MIIYVTSQLICDVKRLYRAPLRFTICYYTSIEHAVAQIALIIVSRLDGSSSEDSNK